MSAKMIAEMSYRGWMSVVTRATAPALLMAGMTAIGGSVSAQTTVSDAQVESNVLKALAGAPELAAAAITTHTQFGVVTLSGSVQSESARQKAENLAANSSGVVKVVDELRLGNVVAVAPAEGAPSQPVPRDTDGARPLVLQSDGTYAPGSTVEGGAQPAGIHDSAKQGDAGQQPLPAAGSAPAEGAQRNDPDADQTLDQQMNQQAGGAQAGDASPRGGYPPSGQYPQSQYPQQSGYPPPGQYPQPNGQIEAGRPPYPNYPSNDPDYPPARYPQRPIYGAGYPRNYPQPNSGYEQSQGGQAAGQSVVVPAGALLRIRINRGLSSDRSQPGSTFDGVVVNDVTAEGFVAIPRGATVQGTVLEAESSGTLKGRGEMSIQLTQVTLGGRSYPLVSDVWEHHGGDKTLETVNKTAGFGAVGAVIGALAGGGVGAAVGGGIGAAAGLGSSAASGNGQVFIPSESIVTFHTARETALFTVSEQEMQRLAYGVPPGADARPLRRPYPRVYVGPGYPVYGRYPGPYAAYGYPPY